MYDRVIDTRGHAMWYQKKQLAT